MIEALLFDAAGTLIAPSEPVGHTYSGILAAHDIRTGPLDEAFRRAFAEAGEPDFAAQPDGDLAERLWWRRVVELSVGESVGDEVFADLFEHYARGTAWKILPGVEAALDAASGLRLAVVSNFDRRLHRVLDELRLASYFELILTSAEARARKPSPAIFHLALQQLGLAPGQVRHIGDSELADGHGAAQAGITAHILGRDVADLHDFVRRVRGA